ncbi:MAG: hypothetical protein PHH06_05610, partial [Candidatus Gracilibacteria bacterium]|nr:hypothetical protein [Candidatus Gracilibacteria bacterium]
LKENKFDLASKEITLLNNNYLDQFYEFLDSSKSGPIGNGTIELNIKKYCIWYKKLYNTRYSFIF